MQHVDVYTVRGKATKSDALSTTNNKYKTQHQHARGR